MSGTKRESTKPSDGPSPGSANTPIIALPPLKPRRGLMITLGILVCIWLLMLLALYFATVWPHRHDRPLSVASWQTLVPVQLKEGTVL